MPYRSASALMTSSHATAEMLAQARALRMRRGSKIQH